MCTFGSFFALTLLLIIIAFVLEWQAAGLWVEPPSDLESLDVGRCKFGWSKVAASWGRSQGSSLWAAHLLTPLNTLCSGHTLLSKGWRTRTCNWQGQISSDRLHLWKSWICLLWMNLKRWTDQMPSSPWKGRIQLPYLNQDHVHHGEHTATKTHLSTKTMSQCLNACNLFEMSAWTRNQSVLENCTYVDSNTTLVKNKQWNGYIFLCSVFQ